MFFFPQLVTLDTWPLFLPDLLPISSLLLLSILGDLDDPNLVPALGSEAVIPEPISKEGHSTLMPLTPLTMWTFIIVTAI